MNTIIKNIKELIYFEDKCLYGEEMKIKVIKDAFIKIKNDIIQDFGSMETWEGISDWNNVEIIDAENGTVMPCYCDSHTHLVFAETRENEFVDRIKGLTYEEIAAKGGGILNSAKAINEITEEELYKISQQRLLKCIKQGTGSIEIKSGYGLTLENELKILRVINRLKQESEIIIKSTFLGAHAIPKDYKKDRKKYIDLIINEMIPEVAKENLADFIDVFCEKNYFSTEETKKIIKAGEKYGMISKIHVNQFNVIGGVKLGVEENSISVDHLENITDEEIKLLSQSNTIATLLPGCSFFLNIKYANAKKMIKENVKIALSTDYNPGSSPTHNMNFIVSLACIKMGITPEQAIIASTINSAHAMGVGQITGSIKKGKKANLIITKDIPSYKYIPYSFSENIINKVLINGKTI